MIKLLKKEITLFQAVQIFFAISVVVLCVYLGYTLQKLKQKENYVQVGLQEAIRLGADEDSLKHKLVKSDTLK